MKDSQTLVERSTPTRTAGRPPIGTVRVDVTRQSGKTFRVDYRTEERAFEIVVDEPTARGGQGSGPSPLGYFVTGAASCLAMQYVNAARELNLPIEGINLLARAHNDRQKRVFTDMIFLVRITGDMSGADAEALARAASDRCFVENTLAQVIPMTTEVHLNGARVTTLSRTPAA